MELGEGFVEVVVGDLFVFDVEPAKDCLVELAALLVVAASIEFFGVLQQGEAGVDEAGAVGEVGAGAVQAGGQAPPLGVDVAELGLDLGLRQGAVGGEVDQVFLLGVEFLDLAGQLLVQQPRGCFVFGDDGVDVGANIGDERLAEPDAGVVALHGVFNELDVDVWRLAGTGAFVAAEKVEVLDAVPVHGTLDDHPLKGARASAASAEHRAFEVVVVHAAAFSGDGS